MDYLEVRIQKVTESDGYEYKEAEILINSKPLVELIKNYELAFAGQLAGSYSSLEKSELLAELEGKAGRDLKKVAVLGCNCGVTDCWPLLVRIIRAEQEVIWTDFEQPYRTNEWSYRNFRPFYFVAWQYDAEVAKLRFA